MKWISVNDKLPEHQTDNYSYDVIVYDSYSRGVARAFYNFDLSEWKYHYNVTDDTFITTHWMPLPEPPKQ